MSTATAGWPAAATESDSLQLAEVERSQWTKTTGIHEPGSSRERHRTPATLNSLSPATAEGGGIAAGRSRRRRTPITAASSTSAPPRNRTRQPKLSSLLRPEPRRFYGLLIPIP